MTALCIESSHQKGMGHLFRMISFADYLRTEKEGFVILVNGDRVSLEILREKGLPFDTVDLKDTVTDWETVMIKKHRICLWLNDRLETSGAHALNVKRNGIGLVTIDDLGDGAALSDIHFASMPCVFNRATKGERVYSGIKYLILNKEIEGYRRKREARGRLLVTFGGSDTYGVTVKAAKIIKKLDLPADFIVGPSFAHKQELVNITEDGFNIKHNPASLIREFAGYDLAVTGGGLTPFEANGSGLPCVIIASEPHETENAVFLDQLGSSVYAGPHDNIQESFFFKNLDIKKMSAAGLERIKTAGAREIYGIIKEGI